MKHLIATLLLVGCLGEVDVELAPECVFEGTYEFGGIPQPYSSECQFFFRESVSERREDACETTVDALAGYLTCTPGDPVTECDGWGTLPAGCEFQLYVRRVAP